MQPMTAEYNIIHAITRAPCPATHRPFLFFYLAFATALLYFIINAALGRYAIKAIVIYIVSFSWGLLICLCIWPPVATLLPREETELGWRIKWDAFVPIPTRKVRRETQLARQPSTQSQQQQQVQTPLADVAEGQGQDQAPSVAGSRIDESPRLPSAPVTPASGTAAPAGMQVVPAGAQGGRGRRSMDRGSLPLAMGVFNDSNLSFAGGEAGGHNLVHVVWPLSKFCEKLAVVQFSVTASRCAVCRMGHVAGGS